MPAGYSSNTKQFLKDVNAWLPAWQVKFAKRLDTMARYTHKSLMMKTPVHEGTTVRNYILTLGSPYGGSELPALGSSAPGQTNSLPLGAEPRRAENEAAASESLTALQIKPNNPYVKIYISNNSESVAGLEIGELPGAPLKSRSPNGMFGITLEQLLSKLESGSM